MKKLMPVLCIIAVIVLIFVVVVAMRPSDFRITRSAKISAPPEKIFPNVNELRLWEPWSPWVKLDPNAKNSFAGPASGVGSAMAWSGNNEVGEGRMTITESRANESVRFRLDFERTMKASNMAEFTFKPEGNQTEVTWTMSGKNGFVGKAFGLFVDCDKMVGCQFEQGLASLKSVSESAAKQ